MRRCPAVATLLYLVFSVVLILLYLPANDLHPDEAHYWVWSTRLQAGYFDNSPLISLVIRASTGALGRSEFAVRFPGALAYVFLAGLLYIFALRVTKARPVALMSVFLFASMPLAIAGAHLATHDIPLAVFGGLTWFFLYQAIVEKTPSRWYPAGVCWGLALLSKYQAMAIGLSAFVMLAASKDLRPWLRRKEPYLAALIALLLFAPTLYWNARNHWVSFAFQFSHGVQARSGVNLLNVLSFYVGQMGVVSPLFFLSLICFAARGLWRHRTLTRDEIFLLGGFLPTLAFFSLTSLTIPAAPNWPLVAYFTAPIFVAKGLAKTDPRGGTFRRAVLASFIPLILIGSWLPVSLARYPEVFRHLGLRLPTNAMIGDELHGWRELGQAIAGALDREGFPKDRPVPVFAETYQVCSEILYYTPRKVEALSTPRYRLSQFDLWTLPALASHDGGDGLLVTAGALNADGLGACFRAVRMIGRFRAEWDGRSIRQFNLYRVCGIRADVIRRGILRKNLGYTPGPFLR